MRELDPLRTEEAAAAVDPWTFLRAAFWNGEGASESAEVRGLIFAASLSRRGRLDPEGPRTARLDDSGVLSVGCKGATGVRIDLTEVALRGTRAVGVTFSLFAIAEREARDRRGWELD